LFVVSRRRRTAPMVTEGRDVGACGFRAGNAPKNRRGAPLSPLAEIVAGARYRVRRRGVTGLRGGAPKKLDKIKSALIESRRVGALNGPRRQPRDAL